MGERAQTVMMRLLQLVVAGVFLWHGVPKALDTAAAMAKFEGWGLPGVLGPVTGWVEVVGVALLFWEPSRRLAAAVLAVVIVGALATVQVPGGVTAGLERDVLLLTVLIVLVLIPASRAVVQPGVASP